MDFLVEHVSLLALSHLKQMSDQVVLRFNALLFQPPNDVRTTGHVPDSDDLLQTEITGRNTGVHAVSEPVVTLSHGLDDS